MIECPVCNSPGQKAILPYDYGKGKWGIKYTCGRTSEGGVLTNCEKIAFLNRCVYNLKTAHEVIIRQDDNSMAKVISHFALETYDKD